MFNFFANIFGYVLSFVYSFVNNYGVAMILFTLIVKLVLLPLSIKQQRSIKVNAELQEEMKTIQFKYKNSPEKMNQEIINLYREKKASPFSGCLTSIVQIILILSVFYIVRSPLTYMQKISDESINNFQNQLVEQGIEVSRAYPQIDIIRESNLIKEKNQDNEDAQKTDINMNFLGLDLSKVPQQSMGDYRVYIIPVLYIISTFISMRITMSMQQKMQNGNENKDAVIDITENDENKKDEEEDPMEAMMQTNKMMSWMMPLVSISIAFVAPLGLALYWLISNIAMIIERLVLNKFIKID